MRQLMTRTVYFGGIERDKDHSILVMISTLCKGGYFAVANTNL